MIYECGGALDCTDHAGKTLLHIAALHGQVALVRWVAKKLDLGGLFQQRDKYYRTAMDDARQMLRVAEERESEGEGEGELSVDVLRDVVAALEEGDFHDSQDKNNNSNSNYRGEVGEPVAI